jgi:hypothetical protein
MNANQDASVIFAAAVGHLESLTDQLRASGWEVRLVVPAEGWPYVRVVNPGMRALNEHIIAAPATDSGVWCFWFSWAERITEVCDLAGTCARIRHVLTPPVPAGA